MSDKSHTCLARFTNYSSRQAILNAAGLRQAFDEFHSRQRRFGAVTPTRLQALR